MAVGLSSLEQGNTLMDASTLTPIEYVVKYDDVQKYVVIYDDVLNFLVMY